MIATGAVNRLWGFVVLVAMMGLLGGCAVSPQEEVEMGREAAPQFVSEFGGLYPDEQIQGYVEQVGGRVAQYAGRPDLPWEFGVVNSEEVNAFALPGGYVYITQGLLFRLENEAQLASILAHEAAHVALRHSVEQLERTQVIQGGALLAGLVGESGVVGNISEVVAGLVLMRYSREQEREADLEGLSYLARAGYDPEASIRSLQVIAAASEGRGPPEFLSTHPSPENRLEFLQERIERGYGDVISVGRLEAQEFERVVLSRRPRGEP